MTDEFKKKALQINKHVHEMTFVYFSIKNNKGSLKRT
jgi:hypothetical protein